MPVRPDGFLIYSEGTFVPERTVREALATVPERFVFRDFAFALQRRGVRQHNALTAYLLQWAKHHGLLYGAVGHTWHKRLA